MNSSAHVPGSWEDQCHQAVLLPAPWRSEVSFRAVRGVHSEKPLCSWGRGRVRFILWVSTWHSQVQRCPGKSLTGRSRSPHLWAMLGYCLAAGLSLWNIKERTTADTTPPRRPTPQGLESG